MQMICKYKNTSQWLIRHYDINITGGVRRSHNDEVNVSK